ncbi:MAG: 3-hydroxyacyl-ACP dehydratase FabZ [Ottowia sp.]|jgi:3-hydroxyacyl-[acyl-carrier-protein] dehydratase|uniref:3-hydroxyacyl-[acyl-carrier-protein] dehydratase FabZ n=1 Tax=Ottowia beijingensis TaxID=1207057 RepID=A0A853IYF4_9BURK|nr:3-hydroxyacyl-ACP dehydratase FabZ [Ottowia beijingensis]MBP6780198.1 3-hydroxyacyl-ACP dehydratase FabZ [Ottowia sp.]MBP7530854.1 3-hydroxyacyl-ACP dehydratase FabZ [Ottowia sp.]MBP7535537.1 3-hydroxyacyl-ACP dehydratase FabZ [Ottowia sp.]MBP9953859.1 3-hydroxyacyl-ACP dehydratase FabZ [Ottowia sp.]NZA02648.1 3-hydroxyacyl-ACP dehydratase FabZ [Ottowia beijingensis]
MMDIYHILTKLPHRYPFLLVDRVLDIDLQAKTIRAIKNVTVNEPCFTGHFPKRPVFPGVLILEALAQSCALLSFETEGIALDDESVFYFVGIDGARFKRPVEPGDQLVLHAAMDRSRGGIYKFKCHADVDGEVAAEAEIMCTMRKVV